MSTARVEIQKMIICYKIRLMVELNEFPIVSMAADLVIYFIFYGLGYILLAFWPFLLQNRRRLHRAELEMFTAQSEDR